MAIGVKLKDLPEVGIPKFRMSLPSIDFGRLIIKCILIAMIDEDPLNRMIVSVSK